MDSNLNLNDMNLPDELVAGTSTLHIEKQPQMATNGVTVKTAVGSGGGAPTLQKVMLKPGTMTGHKAIIAGQKPGANQIVLIQGPGGVPVPVKLIGSNAATLTTNSNVAIQSKVATIMNQQKKLMPAKPVGSVVTAMPRKLINSTPIATVANQSPKVLVSTATGKLVPNHGLVRIATTPAAKTISVNEAKVTEFIKRQQLNKPIMVPVVTMPKPVHTVVDSHIKFKVVQSGGHAGQGQYATKITTPKPSPLVMTGQPQLQTINIPGKNVQYVRLLNPQPNTTIAIRTANGQQKILPAPPPGKVIIQKPGQHISIVNNNSPPIVAKPMVAVTKPTTPMTLDGEKSTETRKMIAVFRKGDIKSGMLPESGKVSTLTTSQLSKLKGAKIISAGENSKTNIVMLPPDYMKQLEDIKAGQRTPPKASTTTNLNTSTDSTKSEGVMKKFFQISPTSNDDSSRKRTCNCTKSQCLKLYCDCFANGEFCGGCNCKDCFNTLANEADRNEAIQMCLERNPHAFKPKVTKGQHEDNSVRHSKGCNCKKSNCLKNYCECYEAKVACTDVCKCTGCRNDGESVPYYDSPSASQTTPAITTTASEVRTYTSISTSAVRQTTTQPSQSQPAVIAQKRSGSPIEYHLPAKISATAAAGSVHLITSRPLTSADSAAMSLPSTSSARPSTSSARPSTSSAIQKPISSAAPAAASSSFLPTKQPYNFMTQDVIEATVQCMIAQADDCQKRRVSQKWAEKMILEEFGRCLVEIIEFSSKPDNEGGVAAV